MRRILWLFFSLCILLVLTACSLLNGHQPHIQTSPVTSEINTTTSSYLETSTGTISATTPITTTTTYATTSTVPVTTVSTTTTPTTTKATTTTTTAATTTTVVTTTTKKTPPSLLKDTYKQIGVGESMTFDDSCEFSIESITTGKEIIPPKPDRFYTYYESDEGKTYVDICVKYKNLATKDVMADEIGTVTVIFGQIYGYETFSIIEEDNRSNFTYSNITSISPLTTEYVHYLASLPDIAIDSNGSIDLVLDFAKTQFHLHYKDGDAGEIIQPSKTAVEIDTGVVQEGETIYNPSAYQFYIDYSDITDDVMPPHPSNYYTHYEADNGKTYVDFCIAYTNLSTVYKEADDILTGQMTYNGKYEFNGFATIEEKNRGSFTYANITDVAPLCEEYIHLLFEVPDSVGEGEESIEIEFQVDGCVYSYIAR